MSWLSHRETPRPTFYLPEDEDPLPFGAQVTAVQAAENLARRATFVSLVTDEGLSGWDLLAISRDIEAEAMVRLGMED